MNTLELQDLETVTGGAGKGLSMSLADQKKNVCDRAQFDWMKAHMVGENMPPTGGVQEHVVRADAKLCGFPM
ncbi:MAG: hypothetical protein QM831_03540 [Kofleriaceae bacterium]